MKKILTAVAALALALTGCSTGTPAAPGESAASAPAGGSGTPLIVYTNSGSDGRDGWLTEQATAAGFNIQIVQAGGGATKDKLINEAQNPVADVAFGMNNFYLEQIAAAGALEPYEPSWADEVDAATGDQSGQGLYWPIVQQGIVLVYNPKAQAGEPADWTDLYSKPEWQGRYETPTALTGATTQMVLSGILMRFQDPNGELGISEEGWQAVETYLKNGRPAEKGVDIYKAMADGQVDAGQMFTSGIPQREKEYGFEAGIAEPSVGVPFATEQVALIKGTKQPEQAKKFIDWFGSAELQGAWSKQYSTMPANKGAEAQTDPAVVEMHKNLKVQDIDWAFVGKNIDAWVEKMTLEYLG